MLIKRHDVISIQRQCELLSLPRRSYYYKAKPESSENLQIMRLLDEIYLEHPYYGYRKMTSILRKKGWNVNEKRIIRLMKLMGIEAIYPKKKKNNISKEHTIYPYLLRDKNITKVHDVWCSDITYIPISGGYFYLTAVMDVFSRYVISWEVSNTMDTSFVLQALKTAIHYGSPKIFNSDQGRQYTSNRFVEYLLSNGIQISMNGKGRCLDNIWIERMWRSVKRENIYLREYQDGKDLFKGLQQYFHHYNFQRPHQALQYQTPSEIFRQNS